MVMGDDFADWILNANVNMLITSKNCIMFEKLFRKNLNLLSPNYE